MSRRVWQDNAACKNADWELFFANGNTREQLETTAEEFCGGCTVRQECSDYADCYRTEGLWGGSYRSGPSRGYQRAALIPDAADGPLPHKTVSTGERSRVHLDDLAHLTFCGVPRQEIANRLGVKPSTLDIAEARAGRQDELNLAGALGESVGWSA